MNNHEQNKIPVGISACLTGQEVRFDGGHKQSRYCLKVLSEFFEYQPFCPEVAIGMTVPREPIRLVGDAANPRVLGVKDSSIDVTEPLQQYAEKVSREHIPHLSGYILMRASPSCGMERVKVYHENGMPNLAGSGVFAARLMRNHPALPVEEEGRLHDPMLCENFISRVFVYHHWKEQVLTNPSLYSVLSFHAKHKLQLMSHSYQGYRSMGKFLATEAAKMPLEQLLDYYITELMTHMTKRATRRSHSNVLMHLLGYLKHVLDSQAKRDLLQCINDYRARQVHLAVPMRLFSHYLQRYGNDYIRSQVYLSPHPDSLGLRNYI